MFRDLIQEVADCYHVVAPDLPGFGMTEQPGRDQFAYTVDNLAKVVGRFNEVLGSTNSRSTSSTMVPRSASAWR